MATKLENLNLEIAHFNKFKEYLPKFEQLDLLTVQIMLEMGIVEVSSAFEQAIAEYSGTEVISEDHADLSCGSDAKLATVRTCNYGNTYSAPVSGIANKRGNLLVQVYERKQDKFYWFVLPYKSYKNIPKTSNIEIPFDLDGNPRRTNKKENNPWLHESKSFEAMCKGETKNKFFLKSYNSFFEE